MIPDRLCNLERYRGMHPNLDTAISYLSGVDLRALPLGRIEVDGEKVFVLLSKPALSQHDKWEKHRKYADIQIMLTPGESIAWAHEDDITGFSEYDESKGDIQLSSHPAQGLICPIPADGFALYFPHDAHRPGLGVGTGYKAVVKVRL